MGILCYMTTTEVQNISMQYKDTTGIISGSLQASLLLHTMNISGMAIKALPWLLATLYSGRLIIARMIVC